MLTMAVAMYSEDFAVLYTWESVWRDGAWSCLFALCLCHGDSIGRNLFVRRLQVCIEIRVVKYVHNLT